MAPSTPAVPAKRALPSKESSLFKDLLSHYESRQLKKGQKAADQILKKFPEHGETLSMKGLVLTHMGKREEGLELVKKGIRLDLTSHICWHVFGLIQKGEKNYEEALKSYTQALRFDKENLNLLQDAANLQTQLRLYDSLQETRHTILKLRPNVRRNWIALAVAYHLNGNLTEARKVLDHYELTLKNIPDYDVEHSEVMLYHIRILEDLGEHTEALSLLDTSAKSRAIVDRMAIMELRARLLAKLGEPDESAHSWRALIENNPEHYDYYRGYLSVKDITLDSVAEEKRGEALGVLQELADQSPKAGAPRRLSLNIAIGDEFKDLVRRYLHNGFTKGIPSLFVDIKTLYSDTTKQQIIEEVVSEFRETLDPSTEKSDPVLAEQPTTYLWTLYFLAQHYSHLSNFKLALSTLDTALAHTPTLLELYSCKARVLKRAGDLVGAAQSIEDARKLDGQDRFVNTKSGKYHLRAGLTDEASEIFGLFTKKDAPSPGADLEDMQSLLFLIEEADAQRRLGKLGLSLKRYIAVQKVFDDIFYDQYDFHSYSVRRFTINIYLNLITWEDKLRCHPASIKSAVGASQIYVRLHDEPKLAASSSSTGNLTGAEKKAQKKAKKAAIKTQEEPKKGAVTSTNEDKGLEPSPAKDDDPEGIKALSVTDPLEQAWKLLKPFAMQTKNSLDVWICIYDVAVRRQKYLQASKALLQARAIDAENPELHIRTIDFKQRVSSLPQPTLEPIGSALASSLTLLLPTELTLDTLNSQYLQRHSASAKAVLASAKVSHKLGAPLNEVEDILFGSLTPEVPIDIKTALASLSFLDELKAPRKDEFRLACDSRFEFSTVFKTPDELGRLRAQIQEGAASDEPPEDKEKQEVLP